MSQSVYRVSLELTVEGSPDPIRVEEALEELIDDAIRKRERHAGVLFADLHDVEALSMEA